MTRRYGHPINVTLAEDGQPCQLQWRDTEYRVRTVQAEWRLRDRWWMTGEATKGASDRHYYRLECDDGLLCVVYHDSVSDWWVLELVHD